MAGEASEHLGPEQSAWVGDEGSDVEVACSVPWARGCPMTTRRASSLLITLTAIFVWPASAPAGRPAVLVNPHVQGNGTAKTIQEGIGMVDPGGKVMVLPGTYNEAIVIDKGLTLEAVGGESDSVIVAPSGAPVAAVLVATSDPVTIRDLTIHFSGANGIRGDGVVDVIAERIRGRAVNPPLGAGSLVP